MKVRPVNENDREFLTSLANEVLKPLYGDQSKAISEWFTGGGYKFAFVSENDLGTVTGFLCLKRNKEKPYVKISTLTVLPAFRGIGVGSLLLQFAITHSIEWYYEKLVVTVSQKKPEALSFFLKNGFVIKENHIGKYDPNVAEFILVKELESSKDLRMKSKYLKMIESGQKTLECRANHNHVTSIKPGDRVVLFNSHCNTSIVILINDVRTYTSIEAMLSFEDYKLLIPGYNTKEEVLNEYRKFYPDEKIARVGGVSVLDFDIIK